MFQRIFVAFNKLLTQFLYTISLYQRVIIFVFFTMKIYLRVFWVNPTIRGLLFLIILMTVLFVSLYISTKIHTKTFDFSMNCRIQAPNFLIRIKMPNTGDVPVIKYHSSIKQIPGLLHVQQTRHSLHFFISVFFL